ncbi:MAG: TonB family protein [Neisseria sp.]|uniref:TonB family protein n=1 Tax=Neisseria sp. TaxID=192066 RepID=UPI0026DB0914|nr:TonB family protein [Neisseria sp.]MDO4641634.1 TonB family protein [Neisseria sp.]
MKKIFFGLITSLAFSGMALAAVEDVQFYEKASQAKTPIKGKLALRLTIKPDGYTENIKVARSSGSQKIDEAAVEWMLHQQLRPVSQNGEARAFSTIKEIKYGY